MKYVNQLEHPHMLYVTRTEPDCKGHERGKTTTIRSSGCGLCSAIMVADRLLPHYEFDLYDAIDLSYSVNANHRSGTDGKLFYPAFAEKLGLKLEFGHTTDDLIHCLETGGAAVAHVGGDRKDHIGLFTHGGHYVAVINREADGRLAILDPSYKEGKFEEPGREGKVEMRNGVVALCEPADLDIDAQVKDIPYYLFWRA